MTDEVDVSASKVLLAALTATEAASLFAAHPVILIPLGSLENQGPHAPMGDYLCAARLAELIALRSTQQGIRALVTPVVPFGVADNFASNIGGIALPAESFKAVLSTMIDAMIHSGAGEIVIINGHGGNVAPIHEVTLAVRKRTGRIIGSLYLWKMGYSLLPKIVGAEHAKASCGHGADPLSSVAFHLFPALCRPDLVPEPKPDLEVLGLRASTFSSVAFEGIDVAMPLESEDLTTTGVRSGDARLSSAATGASLVEELVRISTRFIEYQVGQSRQ